MRYLVEQRNHQRKNTSHLHQKRPCWNSSNSVVSVYIYIYIYTHLLDCCCFCSDKSFRASISTSISTSISSEPLSLPGLATTVPNKNVSLRKRKTVKDWTIYSDFCSQAEVLRPCSFKSIERLTGCSLGHRPQIIESTVAAYGVSRQFVGKNNKTFTLIAFFFLFDAILLERLKAPLNVYVLFYILLRNISIVASRSHNRPNLKCFCF